MIEFFDSQFFAVFAHVAACAATGAAALCVLVCFVTGMNTVFNDDSPHVFRRGCMAVTLFAMCLFLAIVVIPLGVATAKHFYYPAWEPQKAEAAK